MEGSLWVLWFFRVFYKSCHFLHPQHQESSGPLGFNYVTWSTHGGSDWLLSSVLHFFFCLYCFMCTCFCVNVYVYVCVSMCAHSPVWVCLPISVGMEARGWHISSSILNFLRKSHRTWSSQFWLGCLAGEPSALIVSVSQHWSYRCALPHLDFTRCTD